MFCGEEETHIKFPINEVKESHKNNIQVCTITMFLQSDKCNI